MKKVLKETENLRVTTWPVTWPVTWPYSSNPNLSSADFLKDMLKNANLIGRNVARFRYQNGWTQENLAAKMQLFGCHMTQDIVANIETRRSHVIDKWIVVFAEVFGVEIGCLFPRFDGKRYSVI